MKKNIDFSYLCTVKPLSSYTIMECRENCGACCVALSISTPIKGMPDGKPAGVRCIHLLDNFSCAIYNDSDKPKVCSDFKPEPEFCGADRDEALRILYSLSDCPTTTHIFRPPPDSYRDPLKGG